MVHTRFTGLRGTVCAGELRACDEVWELHQVVVAALEQHHELVAAAQAELRQATGQQPESVVPADQPPSSHDDADTAHPVKQHEAESAEAGREALLSRVDADTAHALHQEDEAGCIAHVDAAATFSKRDADIAQPTNHDEAGCAHAAAALLSMRDADTAQRSRQDEAGCSHADPAATSSERLKGPNVQQRSVHSKRKWDAHDDGEGTATQHILFWPFLCVCCLWLL